MMRKPRRAGRVAAAAISAASLASALLLGVLLPGGTCAASPGSPSRSIPAFAYPPSLAGSCARSAAASSSSVGSLLIAGAARSGGGGGNGLAGSPEFDDDEPLVIGEGDGAPLHVSYHRHYYALGEHYKNALQSDAFVNISKATSSKRLLDH